MSQNLTVLTGDLIKSTDLPDGQINIAMTVLQGAALDISAWQNRTPNPCFTRFRGDGWQMLLHNAALAPRAAIYLRAALTAEGKDFGTRIAIASGQGTVPADHDLNRATGPAFVESGRALDGLKGRTTLTWAEGGAVGAFVRLADHLSTGWTPAQARAIREMLPPVPKTHTKVSLALNISRQAVDQALASAGYHALNDALTLLETEMQPH